MPSSLCLMTTTILMFRVIIIIAIAGVLVDRRASTVDIFPLVFPDIRLFTFSLTSLSWSHTTRPTSRDVPESDITVGGIHGILHRQDELSELANYFCCKKQQLEAMKLRFDGLTELVLSTCLSHSGKLRRRSSAAKRGSERIGSSEASTLMLCTLAAPSEAARSSQRKASSLLPSEA